jgi:hypothetical protein
MSDAKYFHTTKRGEIHELKEELHQLDKGKKKEAVKKVNARHRLFTINCHMSYAMSICSEANCAEFPLYL